MGPATRVPGCCRFVSAETLAAARRIQPDRKPSAAWSVIQNNRVAKSVRERARCETCEGGAAISRDRCAGDVDGTCIAASRVIIGNNDLVGVIGISRGECFRLCDVGGRLGAGDEVNIARAIREWRNHFFSNRPTGPRVEVATVADVEPPAV